MNCMASSVSADLSFAYMPISLIVVQKQHRQLMASNYMYLQRFNDYNGQVYQAFCLNMIMRNSWYLSQELCTLASRFLSHCLPSDVKALLNDHSELDR